MECMRRTLTGEMACHYFGGSCSKTSRFAFVALLTDEE